MVSLAIELFPGDCCESFRNSIQGSRELFVCLVPTQSTLHESANIGESQVQIALPEMQRKKFLNFRAMQKLIRERLHPFGRMGYPRVRKCHGIKSVVGARGRATPDIADKKNSLWLTQSLNGGQECF